MKIEHTFPPNIDEIKRHLSLEGNPLFTYGDTIYAPYHEHIPQDIIEHETVHERQQKLFTSPDVWWNKYLYDKQFRLGQELEAYNHQYRSFCDRIKDRNKRALYLFRLATDLGSAQYGNIISPTEAQKRIKNYKS